MISAETVYRTLEKSLPEERFAIAGTITDELIRSWLIDKNWRVRNCAVKIIGLMKREQYVQDLVCIMTDRTSVPIINRLFGGDFYQVGFIRRNAASALGAIGIITPEVISGLFCALRDPYWEVRVESIRTCRKLFSHNSPLELFEVISRLTSDRSFEVVVEAVTAMGELASDSSVVNELRNVYNHPNVLVKTAGVNALKKLYERAVITDKMIIIRELSNIFIPGKYANNNRP